VIDASSNLYFLSTSPAKPHALSRRHGFISTTQGGHLLNTTILVLGSTSLAITFLVLALVREVRLRRALQRLLAKLLAHWRKHNAEDRTPP
jgi:hypothetical protein